MATRNRAIVALIVVGLLLSGWVYGYVMPRLERSRVQYWADQEDPLTHSFDRIARYQSPYMGDASNLGNLFSALPLGSVNRSLRLLPEALTVHVIYEERVSSIGHEKVERSLIYNATAAFGLIDNLETVVFTFGDRSYEVHRVDMEAWYGANLASLASEDVWAEQVQDNLAEEDYVQRFMEHVFYGN